MVLEGVSICKSPVTGVTLVGWLLAGRGQESVVLLLADHSDYLAVSRGQGDGLSLHHLLLLYVHAVLLYTHNVMVIYNFKVLLVLNYFLLHLSFNDLLAKLLLQQKICRLLDTFLVLVVNLLDLSTVRVHVLNINVPPSAAHLLPDDV